LLVSGAKEVPNGLFNFLLVKNDKAAKQTTATQSREQKSTDLESLELKIMYQMGKDISKTLVQRHLPYICDVISFMSDAI
jgi:uncharacterized protein (UPF0303 family)